MADSFSTMAAALPPPGKETNFIDPPSQQGAIIGVCTVMIILTLSTVLLRLYSNFKVTRTPGVEDCKYHRLLMHLNEVN